MAALKGRQPPRQPPWTPPSKYQRPKSIWQRGSGFLRTVEVAFIFGAWIGGLAAFGNLMIASIILASGLLIGIYAVLAEPTWRNGTRISLCFLSLVWFSASAGIVYYENIHQGDPGETISSHLKLSLIMDDGAIYHQIPFHLLATNTSNSTISIIRTVVKLSHENWLELGNQKPRVIAPGDDLDIPEIARNPFDWAEIQIDYFGDIYGKKTEYTSIYRYAFFDYPKVGVVNSPMAKRETFLDKKLQGPSAFFYKDRKTGELKIEGGYTPDNWWESTNPQAAVPPIQAPRQLPERK